MKLSFQGSVVGKKRVVFVVFMVLAACSGAPGPDGGPAKRVAGFPRDIENCGHLTSYKAPPERAITFDQNVTEMLLALGLEDRIVGFARQHFVEEDPVLAEYEESYRKLNLISEGDIPRKEPLLALNPDFVLAAFPYELSAQFGTSRESLESDGIATYVQQVECGDEAERVTFEQHHEDVRQLGRIFAVEDRAEALIAEMTRELDSVRAALAAKGGQPVRVFVYDSGTSAPLTTGGTSMSNAIIEAAGGVNIFKDIPQHFPEVSWEEVLARDPEVIVTMEYSISEPPSSAYRDLLEQRLASTTAMEQDRVTSLPLIAFFPGVRNPATVETLARFLSPEPG